MMFLPYIFLAAGFGVLAIPLAIALIAGIVKVAGWTVAFLLFVDEIRESLARRVSEQLKIHGCGKGFAESANG